MTIKEAWKIYHENPHYKSKWENLETHNGLLLPICAHCNYAATRKTYVGFWKEFFTLIQDYVITAIAKCPQCLKWNAYQC